MAENRKILDTNFSTIFFHEMITVAEENIIIGEKIGDSDVDDDFWVMVKEFRCW